MIYVIMRCWWCEIPWRLPDVTVMKCVPAVLTRYFPFLLLALRQVRRGGCWWSATHDRWEAALRKEQGRAPGILGVTLGESLCQVRASRAWVAGEYCILRPFHSPLVQPYNGRQFARELYKGTVSGLWKTTEIHSGNVESTIHCDLGIPNLYLITKGWCQPIGGHVSYPLTVIRPPGGCFINVSRALQNILSNFFVLQKSHFLWAFQAETFFVCPKLCFGHTYKVSAWNSHHKCDYWHCIFSRDYFGELVKR